MVAADIVQYLWCTGKVTSVVLHLGMIFKKSLIFAGMVTLITFDFFKLDCRPEDPGMQEVSYYLYFPGLIPVGWLSNCQFRIRKVHPQ